MKKAFLMTVLAIVCVTVNSQSRAITPVTVSDSEIATLAETLWTLDVNNVANLITINVQSSTNSRQGTDTSPNPLLSVPASVYQKPTISKLIPLQDNYIPAASSSENVTPQETAEETAFLDAIFATSVIKKAEQFLIDKGYILTRTYTRDGRVIVNNNAFREAFRQIWFGMYAREGRNLGSSGFEHVFLGETKAGQVSGFHNWIFFSKQETTRAVNYHGHLRVLRLGPKGMVLKHNFNWNGATKPVTSMFIGTSPEFEFALYTVCFYVRPGARCPVTIAGKSVPITTHFINRQGKRYVGSAFPDI